MMFRLVDIGRFKFNGEVKADSFAMLLNAVRKHLASRAVDICEDGTVLAGDRPVGRVEPLSESARQQLAIWTEQFN